MSLAATNWVWSLRLGDANRKLILLKYADHAHDDGRNTWVKPKKVADFAECSERTVQRHLGALLDDGFMREGDQTAYVWPKNHTGPREARYQPIVYDLAMDEETRLQWKAERADGATRRDRHVNGGSVRYGRGDTVTPLPEGDLSSQVTRGDIVSPPLANGAEVTNDLAPEVTDDLGVEHESEVTLVSPKETVLEPSIEDEPSEGQKHLGAAAPVIDIHSKREQSSLFEDDEAVDQPPPTAGPAFEDFYAGYPNKKARGDAEKAWRQVTKAGAHPQDVMDGLARYLDYLDRRPERRAFMKHPATWLRAQCWLDVYEDDAALERPGGRAPAYSNDQWKADPTGGWGDAALGEQ